MPGFGELERLTPKERNMEANNDNEIAFELQNERLQEENKKLQKRIKEQEELINALRGEIIND